MSPPYVVSFEELGFAYGGLSITVAANMGNNTLFRFKATDTGICYEGNLVLNQAGQVNIFNKVSEDGSFAGSSPEETPTPTATLTAPGFIQGDDETPTPVSDCCDQQSGWKSVVVKEASSEDPVDSEDGVTAIGTPGKLCFPDIVGFDPYPLSYLVSLDTDDYLNGGFSVTIQGTMSDTTFRYIKDETGVCYIGTLASTADQGINVFTQE